MTQLWAVSSCQQQISGSLARLFIDLTLVHLQLFRPSEQALSCSLSAFFLVLPLLYVFFFDVSKEAWNVIELSFSNVLLLALMRIRAIAWKCWVKEKRGPAPPRADRIPQLCSIFISVSRMWVKQEVFTSPDFASYLPALLPRHLTKYRPPVVRLTPGPKWNNP